ncbi:venom metalloproteinase antarease-like TtrivMP_A isoform X1 [Dermacentor silvarum]|uniref:venom metalloproteinase antarease-like TtrivMP_A isoform X1 n=1 Tax=Dermacentor silvarum TaxID=543639 RepID=UPI00189BF4E8|nr:venom metalloproteinase antarease-like TtrivMP_A isoform X1 [Dermacentor silvarum]
MIVFMVLIRIVHSCYAQNEPFVYPSIVEERMATKNLVVRLNDEFILNLEKSSVLADNLLFVTRSSTGHSYKTMDTSGIQNNLYHDSHHQSSLYVTREDGVLQMEGIINHKLRIKPLLQSERSAQGQVLHNIYEVQEIRAVLESAMAFHPAELRTLQSGIPTLRYPTTRAPRTVDNFTVELHIISDEEHQSSFRNEKDLTIYLAVMTNAVNRIFVDMKMPSIAFKLVGITKSTDDTFASNFLDTAEAMETLERLVDYAEANKILETSDLVYLVTNRNLARLRNGTDTGALTLDKAVAGLAYVGTVCTRAAVAEGEDIAKSYVGTLTMAHELAHSLGATHDPNNNSDCSWAHGFLMSYEDNGSNKFRLSKCSKTSIQNVVERLSDTCLLEKASKVYTVDDMKLPGDRIVRNYFCRLALQKNSRGFFNFQQDPDNDCKLRCYFYKVNGTVTQTWYMTFDMVEGMWCGGNKTCQRGICTEEAPTS